MRGRAAVVVATVALLSAPVGVHAQEEPDYAPLDRPGPELQVPADDLAASLRCATDPAVSRPTVLLVHGTALDHEANFGWNYVPALADAGRAVCGVQLPGHAMGEIPVSAEYVVHAIRHLAATTGEKVQVVGYSQGGQVPRWALRWWPDLRPLVEEVVSLAATNHGTVDANASCARECVPSYWQQRLGSDYVQALNSRTETFETIDYTNVYTRTDQIVQPNLDDTGTSSLRGGANVTNVATQEVCPTNAADHLALGTYDPVAWALVLDALSNPGPADPSRVPLEVCTEAFMPGVDRESFASDYAGLLAVIAEAQDSADAVPQEPPLPCYVTASCASPAGDDAAAAPGTTDPEGGAGPTLPATGGGAASIAYLALLGVCVLTRRSTPLSRLT